METLINIVEYIFLLALGLVGLFSIIFISTLFITFLKELFGGKLPKL